MRARRTFARGASLLAVLVLAGSCAQDKLQSLDKLYLNTPSYVRVEADFCESPPVISKQKVKYLFILDKSESNQLVATTLVAGDVSGTDPSGGRRYGPLRQFVKTLPVDPNQLTSFSMINFNDKAFIPSSSHFVNGFDPDRNNFINVVQDEWGVTGSTDKGFTNYDSALQMALVMIQRDAMAESVSTTRPIVTSAYRLIFVSDGEPVVPLVTGGSTTVTQQFTPTLKNDIDTILSLKTDLVVGPYISDIILNTAYYFNTTQDQNAITLLQQMAAEGNGQFMKFGAGENILYGAFAPPIRNVRQLLADFFVENESAVWWDDGTFQMDSDGDGLPDIIEDKLGSNKMVRDTDGNGVSDLVEYRLKGQPCQDAACAAANRNPFSVCDGLSPSTDAAGNVTFPDFDKDGLNDCEEFVLHTDRTKFDSNGDFIPDLLALKTGVPFIAGVNGAFLQPQGDGVFNYNKLKLGLPIAIPKDKVLNFKTRLTSLSKTPQVLDGVRDCYHAVVNQVAVLGPNNLIKFMVIENSAIIDDKTTMRSAEKRLDGGSSVIKFVDSDFQ